MDLSIPEMLSDERSLGVFLLVSVIMGGGAAWLVALYMLILSLAVRFIHFALFDSKLLSLHYYLVDFAVCLGFGYLGFRGMRRNRMVTRYSWIIERAGFMGWRRRDSSTTANQPKSG
jgi:hypothetical protein